MAAITSALGNYSGFSASIDLGFSLPLRYFEVHGLFMNNSL
jgi:hypothetical protein